MECGPSVVVKKNGFLSSLARGVFGLLTATVVCAAGVGVYALHVVDGRIDQVLRLGESVASGAATLTVDALKNAEHIRDALPPVLADALRDRRALDYRDRIVVDAQLVDARSRRGMQRVVVRVMNNGTEAVSVMALNLVLRDADGVPLRDFRTYAATPVTIPDEDEWRGPLPPGGARTYVLWVRAEDAARSVLCELTDLRVFEGPAAGDAAPRVVLDDGE